MLSAEVIDILFLSCAALTLALIAYEWWRQQ
jgi:hypothetical protein